MEIFTIMAQLISIIIPVYNHAEELLACLDSIEQQTYRNVEVIIVDDASTVPVAQCLHGKSYSFSYELIRSETNQDAPRARNEGFKHSTGEYVLFLDADIVLRPHALETMASILRKDPHVVFTYASFYFGWKLFRGRVFDQTALRDRNYIHTSSLLRRSAFPEFDPRFKKFQDWDLWLTIVENGGEGFWIDEALFTIAPHTGGKSQWLPRIAYHIPWPIFGYTPPSIRRYRDAEKMIQEKHVRPLIDPSHHTVISETKDPLPPLARPIWLWMSVILVLECLSALSIFTPKLNSIFALSVATMVGIIAIIRPLWAVTFLSAELVIGSKGGLLKYGADQTNNGGINLRILIFIAFMMGWCINVLWTKSWKHWRHFLRQRWIYVALAVMLSFAFIRGWMLGQHTFLFSDANAWGMWVLLLPVLDIATTKAHNWRTIFLPGLIAATLWMFIETLLLFYFFSHGFYDAVGPVYYWIRRSGVGEMTKVLPDVLIYRIFFQSHLYAACLAVGGFVMTLFLGVRTRWMMVWRVLALASVLVSLSRSLWIGLTTAYVCTIVYGLFAMRVDRIKLFWKRAITREMRLGILSILLVTGIAWFPFPMSQPSSLLQVIESRTDTQEDAARSRWELLPVLQNKIQEHPILGSGFGSTVSYRSHDPRIVASKQKVYTTFATEWGWHEFWIKFGIIGIPLMAAILFFLHRRVRRSALPHWFQAVVASILVLLAVTHLFTPYLNHPLGFFLILSIEGALMWSTMRVTRQEFPTT